MKFLRKLLFAGLALFLLIPRLQAQPVITSQPASQTNLPGTTVSFSLGVNGTGPFTYQWQFNGTNLPNIITTFAGNGNGGYSGDGGMAIYAGLTLPSGVAFDASGNLYIADEYNQRIRKVATNSIITTVAGKSGSGYSGDGGAATNASLYYPIGVTFDAIGNLYIADYNNNRIRTVATNGIITTVAGNGTGAYAGDGGAATNASLYNPEGVTFDAAGNLYIADASNYRVRKVDTNGIITTVAGNGTGAYAGDGGAATNASLYNPEGVTFDAAGNLYIADTSNNRIRKVDTNGIITTVAGGGSGGDGGAATNASIYYPSGVAFDAFGNLYIADEGNNRIRKVDNNGIIITVAGNGSAIYAGDGGAAINAGLYYPSGVAFDASGNLYIADALNARIRAVNFAGYPKLTLNNVSVTNAGNYTVVVTNSYGSVTSAVATLTVAAPAVITVQPASQIAALAGSSPSFSVAVVGSGPFGYEWYFAGTNLIQIGTNSTLTLPNVSTNNAGNYTVMITNNYGSVTSQIATLLVGFPPTLNSQPGSQTNLPGTTLSFSVGVNGTGPFTYQWQFNGTNLPNNLITTVAGNGIAGYTGDGGAATNARLHFPSSLAFDASGNLYIGDNSNARIRKVDTNGIITTFAGGGGGGGSDGLGDGGAATNASLRFSLCVAFDASGNLYIADPGNERIRKVDTNGIITTVAGNGITGYNGDGVAATSTPLWNPDGVACDASGNFYIADLNNDLIRKVATNGIITTVAGKWPNQSFAGDGGAATNASLNLPFAVAFDTSGNMYIADQSNNRIRKVATNGSITTVAGNGTGAYAGDGGAATSASLNHPSAIACDAFGNQYIADQGNNRIRKVDTNDIIITVTGNGSATYSGDGSAATNASLASPYGVAFDASGNMYIADYGHNRIRKVLLYAGYPTFTLNNIGATNAGNYTVVITSPYGSVTSQVATLSVVLPPTITTQPISQTNLPGTTVTFSVAVNGTGPFSYQWQFNGTNFPNNIITTVAGNGSGLGYAGDGGAATKASLLSPVGVAFDAAGNLYISDTLNLSIFKVDTNGIITTALLVNSSVLGTVDFDVSGNMYFPDGSIVYMMATNGIITIVAGGGHAYPGDGSAATNADLGSIFGVGFDAFGNLYIADPGTSRVRKVDTNGIITTVAGNGIGIYAGDGGAATNASLNIPYGVAFDAFGNLYIADENNSRIRKVDTNGIITTVAGGGSANPGAGGPATKARLVHPSGVAFDVSGNLYIADDGGNVICKVATNGIITTVAGNGSANYAGDGGAATNASLNDPSGVAFDASGNLYIADYNNRRIRKVLLYAGYPTFTLGNIGVFNAGNYTVVITSPYGSVTSVVATLTVPVPPVITTQPASQITAVGSSPSFSVAIAGSGPFGYEWYIAATNLVQSGTNNTLTLPGVSTNNTGNYTVVVTNNYGSVTSQVATLTVALPPSVSTLPASQTNLAGSTVSFSVAVAGIGPFTYQWQFNGTNLPNNIITTVAGNGSTNYAGDGGAATNASLFHPTGVALDTVGELFIADQANNRIRRVGTDGIITTVAGNNNAGYYGDGGAATNAGLTFPQNVGFDAMGNLYIAGYNDERIRKVNTNGIITTVAGNGTGTYAGDGGTAINASLNRPTGVIFDGSGNMYIADRSNNRIRKVDANGIITTVAGKSSSGYSGDGGAATNASLNGPYGVAFDAAGNMYIPDSGNSRIRKVDTNGIITTVAGNGTNSYSGDDGAATNTSLNAPQGVAFDATGNLYIADWLNSRISKVDTNGIITTVAGNGNYGYSGDGSAATNSSLFEPPCIIFDVSGNMYIADWLNNRIREVHFAGYPNFALNNVSITNAGNYTVVITSSYGSVTGAVAALTVIIPPQIIVSDNNFGFVSNQFGFNLNGAVGQTIVVDGSTNLVNWTPLITNTAGGTPAYFFDPTSTNFPGRFYRLRLQ